jgi:hypothetical protein
LRGSVTGTERAATLFTMYKNLPAESSPAFRHFCQVLAKVGPMSTGTHHNFSDSFGAIYPEPRNYETLSDAQWEVCGHVQDLVDAFNASKRA